MNTIESACAGRLNMLGKALVITLVLAIPSLLSAESLWEKTKDIAGDTADIAKRTVSDTVDTAEKVATNKKEDPVAARAEIDKMAEATLAKLFNKAGSAQNTFKSAYGYAVFDSRVSSFGFTTGFGKGVAVDQTDQHRTYMKMASGGANLGVGIQYYQVVFLFPNEKTFKRFVDVGWDAGANARGAAGEDGADMGITLENGVSVYQINEKGIMLAASLTGTKYWKFDELNAGP